PRGEGVGRILTDAAVHDRGQPLRGDLVGPTARIDGGQERKGTRLAGASALILQVVDDHTVRAEPLEPLALPAGDLAQPLRRGGALGRSEAVERDPGPPGPELVEQHLGHGVARYHRYRRGVTAARCTRGRSATWRSARRSR